MPFQILIDQEQLNNAVTLLEKGYKLDTDMDELLQAYDKIEDIPKATE